MGRSLVIVESPAKAKTINKYLGKAFVVKSSIGHIRDLPTGAEEKDKEGEVVAAGVTAKAPKGKKAAGKTAQAASARAAVGWDAKPALVRRMGVDPEHGWEARYQILPGKEKTLKELQELAADADTIYLATDLDREGEAIAWHLREAIGGDPSRFARVTFSEITKRAIQDAFAKPGVLNMDRVHAQHARRYLDRVVGFMVSPLLWRKVARGLSAGRVQSVATRLVVEREREIQAFTPEEYWELHARLHQADKTPVKAEVIRCDNDKVAFPDRASIDIALGELQPATYRVQTVEAKESQSRPSAPFITSTLQQAASVRLSFGVKKTMTLAQRLYEAGFITYMRTDAVSLSPEAVAMAREHIAKTYGSEFVPDKPNVYGSREGAQEAHEAIRPTDVRQEPADLAGAEPDAQRLYDLIRRQFIACQMKPAIYDVTTAEIIAGRWGLRARGRVVRFPGWTAVLPPSRSKDDELAELPPLKAGEILALDSLDPTQHFTKPPARYTEASLVREMEKRGIGRPSTYAATISTIQDRGYVRMDSRRLFAEKMGEIVTDRLVDSFPDLLDYGFTAGMENNLDQVAQGRADWKQELDRFYAGFTQRLSAAETGMRSNDPTATGIPCGTCGREMMLRTGRTGVFLGCSGYNLPPKERCTATMNLTPGEESVATTDAESDEGSAAEALALKNKRRCQLCGTAMDSWLIDATRRLHVCGRHPDCAGTAIETGSFRIKGYEGPSLPCDKCGSPMELKTGRFGKFFGCTNSTCKNTRKLLRNGQAAPPRAKAVAMPELPCQKGGHFVLRDGAQGLFLASNLYPKVRETRNPLVRELAAHRAELDPKHQHLADAPASDPAGNPAILRWSRKHAEQYVNSETDGKASGWSAWWRNGQWVATTAADKE